MDYGQWRAAVCALDWKHRAGSKDLYVMNPGSNTSVTVTGLPTDSRTLGTVAVVVAGQRRLAVQRLYVHRIL